MSTDEFTPDLRNLATDYQIFHPLRRSANEKTYLARHRKLDRDVTITFVRPRGSDNNALTHFASDARTLAVMRHRNVVRVIEGRWLPDRTFAVVRARVRGSTLTELIGKARRFSVPQAATSLEQVYIAVEWSRENGIVHRHLTTDSIVIQQGSGRVMVELDPWPITAGSLPDDCDDARTIGRLAYEMLSGHRASDADAPPLATARPDLPSRIVRETEALMQCDSEHGARDAAGLIALMGGKPKPAVAPVPVAAPVAAPPVVIPVGPLDSAVAVVKRPFGYTARVVSAVLTVGVVAVLGLLVLRRRDPVSVRQVATSETRTTVHAAGEVALSVPPPLLDTAARPVATAAIPPASATTPEAAPPKPRRPQPPETRQSEPPRGLASSVMPSLTAPVPPIATIDSALGKPVASVNACDDAIQQNTCLAAAIGRDDREMNAMYERVTAALRRQADVQPGDPDPPSVEALREAQQRWLDSRVAACRDAGTGLLYARARAVCYAEQSAKRASELGQMLANLPGSAPPR